MRRLAAEGAQPINASTIVLSACEAGAIGGTIDSDEYVGLPSTLIELGASTVIAPLWAVSDDAALNSINQFYGALEADSERPNVGAAMVTMRCKMRAGIWPENLDLEPLSNPRLRRFSTDENTRNILQEPTTSESLKDPIHWAAWARFGI